MTNREEIAEKWRETGERLDKEPPISLTSTACITLFELLESAGIRDNNSYSDVFNRLADLIDPTCHMVDSKWDNGECTWGCICKECGAKFEHKCAAFLNYCPRCGARVVRDEA